MHTMQRKVLEMGIVTKGRRGAKEKEKQHQLLSYYTSDHEAQPPKKTYLTVA